ncbi:MAG TPA: hypothetical protein VGD88_14550 [Opitutaceae bacterium]
MISTRRRLEYATGYLELGLTAQAAAELAAIDPADQDLIEVLRVRSEYHMQAKEWESLINVAASLARRAPDDESGWISWAYALRELNRVEEARSVLQEAELRHGKTCGVLHYNLACYACLLGNHLEALRRLRRALRINEEWKQSALGDTDLQPLWPEIAEMK